MSISPLDRLLNQRGLDDEVGVEISCSGRKSGSTSSTPNNFFSTDSASMQGAVMKNYKLTMKKPMINELTCWDGSKAGKDGCKKDGGQVL